MTLRKYAAGLLVALTLSTTSAPSPQPVAYAAMADGSELVKVPVALPSSVPNITYTIVPPKPFTVTTADKMKAHDTLSNWKKTKFVWNADHYYFEPPVSYAENTSFRVKVIYYKSFDDLAIAWGDRKLSGQLMAFTYPHKMGTDVCEIHIMHPSVIWYPQYVGHEFTHCTHGDFHRTQN
jgi:hypothetical protein